MKARSIDRPGGRLFHFLIRLRAVPLPPNGGRRMADGKESRFAHLLEPLRDLSQNWSVDLAGELSDYLAQLEEISFTFDGGATSLNFAEGAARAAR